MYCQVTIRVQTQNSEPRDVWFVLRSDQESIRDLYAEMNANGAVYGERLDTRAARGGRIVVDQYETIVAREALVSISEMQSDLIGQDGQKLWTFEGAQ